MDKANLIITIVAIAITNGISIGAMVWKMSGWFHKLQAELISMQKQNELTNKFFDDRTKANESQILKMFELIYDLQKRTTTVEVRQEKGRD